MTRQNPHKCGLWILAAATMMLTAIVPAQENIGTVRQPLVGGSVVDATRQEDFGLVTLNDGSCSASLLRNDWVITAAHCVDVKDDKGKFIPDPARPGQNMENPIAGMNVTANWNTSQSKNVVRLETFRPYDVALIKVDTPFKVHGSTTGYSRLIFQDGQFPYFGEPVGADLLVFGQGINVFATGAGDTAMPSQGDGQYRMTYAKATYDKDNRYWYPSVNGQMIAGGDSGGPSFAWVLSGYALVGVHSLTHATYAAGHDFKEGDDPWMWVTSTPEAADAPIAPVWNQIAQIMGPAPPADGVLGEPYPPTGNVGTFATTPKNYQPMWVYGIQPDGKMLWYRKDSGDAPWQGPQRVGTGWNSFKDVIAAGGNSFYALTTNDKLLWYQHNGFNNGARDWKPAVEVGSGWTFKKIFAGGEGIVYAIRQDGKLFWYKNNGADYGVRDWQGAKEVGAGWGDFKDVFSTGKGAVYAVTQEGKLLIYQQKDYLNGVKDWWPAREIGTGWGDFQQIVPAGDGVILAISKDGKLRWYRDRGLYSPVRFGRLKQTWEGPVEIGSGWQDFSKVIALLPVATPVGPR